MNLAEYLHLRREVETADTKLIFRADELKKQVAKMNLPTINQMWDAIEQLAKNEEMQRDDGDEQV